MSAQILTNDEKKRITLERQKAVRKAWKEEVRRVRSGTSTRKWSSSEKKELLERGSVCKKGKYIYCITTDNCSRFLITQYSKKGLDKRKSKLLNSNYIFFNGDYYSLNLNDGVVVRLIRNEEFECDYGFELIFNEELVNKLANIAKGI